MVICLFGQRYPDNLDLDELNRISDELLAELQRSPGFISYNVYRGEDGEDLGIVRFESRDALEAWRDNHLHRSTWARATEFFAEFWIQNSDTYREYLWKDGVRQDVNVEDLFRSRSENLASFGAS